MSEKSSDLLLVKNKEIERIREEEKAFLDNLEKYKSRIKKNDFLAINNWNFNKKGSIFKGSYKKKRVIIEPFLLKMKQIVNLLFNFNDNLMSFLGGFANLTLINVNYNYAEKKFFKIQLKKLKLVEGKKYFNNNKILYIIVDIRKLKTKIIVLNKSNNLFFITNGLIYKKMNLKNKKNKKSEKTTNLVLKSLIRKKNIFTKYKKIIIYVKGVKKYMINIIKYIKLNLMDKVNGDVIFVLNNRFHKSTKFNFKKIRSIKRKLKKKIIKLK